MRDGVVAAAVFALVFAASGYVRHWVYAQTYRNPAPIVLPTKANYQNI